MEPVEWSIDRAVGRMVDAGAHGVVADGAFSGGAWTGTDNLNALTAAVAATPQGGILLLPQGLIRCEGTIPTTSGPIRIMGRGGLSEMFSVGPGVQLSASVLVSNTPAPMFHFAGTGGSPYTSNSRSELSCLAICGVIDAGSGQVGVWVDNRHGITMRDVFISNCGGDGLRLTDSVGGLYENVISYTNAGCGVKLDNTLATDKKQSDVANNIFINLQAINALSDGLRIQGAAWGNVFLGGLLEDNFGGWDLVITAASGSDVQRFNRMVGVWQETNSPTTVKNVPRQTQTLSTTPSSLTVASIIASWPAKGKFTVAGLPVGVQVSYTGISGNTFERCTIPPETSIPSGTFSPADGAEVFGGGVYIADKGPTDNELDFVRLTNNPVLGTTAALSNALHYSNLDPSYAKRAQRKVWQFPDIRAGGLAASDLPRVRIRNYNDTNDGNIEAASLIITFGQSVGPGTYLSGLHVPQGVDAICLPADRGITGMNSAGNGTRQFLLDTGAKTLVGVSGSVTQIQGLLQLLAGGANLSSGTGAPATPNRVNPTKGDVYWRIDTQQFYTCETGGSSPVWGLVTAPSDMNCQQFTSSGTWTVPAGVTQALFVLTSGGNGGAGGGSASSNIAQAGGGSGAAGQTIEQLITGLTPGHVITFKVGAGGSGGTGGGSGGNPGSPGGLGGTSTIVDTTAGVTLMVAVNTTTPPTGSAANSTAGGATGSPFGNTIAGDENGVNYLNQGYGSPGGYRSPAPTRDGTVGGSGGGVATTAGPKPKGGGGGLAQQSGAYVAVQSAPTAGASSTADGLNGQTATQPGCGGGGGGGGAMGGRGGQGGAGARGFGSVRW